MLSKADEFRAQLAAEENPVPREWEIFSSDIGQALWEALQRPDWPKKVRRGFPGATACAFDYLSFSVDGSRQYQRLRFTRYIHCQRFTVNTTPCFVRAGTKEWLRGDRTKE
jgi:hypothetical protein